MVPMLEHLCSSNLATLFRRCKDESLIESFSLCQAAKSAACKILQNKADETMQPPRKEPLKKWGGQGGKGGGSSVEIVGENRKENALVEIFPVQHEG